MSAHRLVHAVRQIARDEAAQHWTSALGVVRSLHHDQGDHACSVELRESGLVLPRVPIAVGVMGAAALPREGDLVVVLFSQGDLHDPVVIGCLYNETVAAPAHVPGQVVLSFPGGEDADDARLVVTVECQDDGTRCASVHVGGTHPVDVKVDAQSVAATAGVAKLLVQQTSDSDARAELSVDQSSVVIEQNGNVTVDATGTLKLHATNVEISGDATVKVAGQTIDLN